MEIFDDVVLQQMGFVKHEIEHELVYILDPEDSDFWWKIRPAKTDSIFIEKHSHQYLPVRKEYKVDEPSDVFAAYSHFTSLF